ncbi:MAG: tyrosine-type recombinase/integrase [Endozoicomonas sp.]
MKQKQEQSFANTFEAVGREWFEVKQCDKSAGHQFRSMRLLERELFPHTGSRPVAEITAPELLAVLRRTEGRGVIEIAHRAKQTAGQVFQYAIATGRAERNPSKDLNGALKVASKTHFSAITTPKEAGQLMMAIYTYKGSFIVQSALRLSPLIFLRPKELRHLEWSEINWEERRIEIPAEKI